MVDKRASKFPTQEEYEHSPLSVPRVPISEQEPGFLEDLRARGEVLAVDDGWDDTAQDLPSGVNWVVFPNGDLLRVRI